MAYRIKIEIETHNAAFQEFGGIESARILESLARRWTVLGVTDSTLRDVNGNACGRVTVKRARRARLS